MFKATIEKACTLLFALVFVFALSADSRAQNTFYGSNIILDGDFSGDTLSNKWVVEGTAGTASVINGELAFTNLVVTANQYDFQVNQPFSEEQLAALAEGGTFELSFDARTTAESKTFHAFLGEVGGSWARFWNSPGDGDITVDNTTKTYTLTTEVVELTWAAMRLGFEVSTDTSSLFIDNVQLRKVTDNIVRNGDFSADSAWTPEIQGSSTGNVAIVNGELAITGLDGGGPQFSVQAYQLFTEEQRDSIYTGAYELSFDARTTAESKTFHVFLGEVGGGWDRYWPSPGAGDVTVSNTMATYTLNTAVEKKWDNMRIGFEVNTDTSSVFIDNVILKRVTDVKPDAPQFALSTENGVVTITVVDQGAGSYDVFFADTAFTDKDGGAYVGTIDPTEGLTLTHTTYAPHPDLASDFTAHYGVIARSAKGTGSDLTSSSISTGMAPSPNYAYELSPADAGAIATIVGNGDPIPDAATIASYFPSNYVPFETNSSSKVSEGTASDGDSDLSTKHWIGFDPANSFIIIYAEVTDDSLVFATDAEGTGGAWNFDSWEMGIGNYTPESILQGSTHGDLLGGEEPDWQLRGGILNDKGTERGFIHAYGKGARIDGEIPNSATLAERTENGYRTLTLIVGSELTGGVTNDRAFAFPSGNELHAYPLNVAVNDNDAAGRETQLSWATRVQNGNWWQNPFQWDMVAFVGQGKVPVSNENEDFGIVREYALNQNYPNPFNPTTNITFTLANSGNVTLEVFNMLGQKVATLLEQESLTVGTHSRKFDASSLASGMYVYRLSSGNFVQSRKMMLIK